MTACKRAASALDSTFGSGRGSDPTPEAVPYWGVPSLTGVAVIDNRSQGKREVATAQELVDMSQHLAYDFARQDNRKYRRSDRWASRLAIGKAKSRRRSVADLPCT
jgi:hypothetical protein